MSDTSGALIGGALSDIENVTTRLAAAGGASVTHASDAAATAQVLVDEIGDVTNHLTTTFIGLAEALRTEITAARTTLGAANWTGRSRGAADAAEADLHTQTSAVLEAAQQGVDELSGVLLRMVLSFHGDVAGQFANVMNQINERYQALGRGTTAFAEGLRQVDSTISYG
ncbi:MAG: hypothetical protein ACE367_08615 [Acidimicrobiales bacterium]